MGLQGEGEETGYVCAHCSSCCTYRIIVSSNQSCNTRSPQILLSRGHQAELRSSSVIIILNNFVLLNSKVAMLVCLDLMAFVCSTRCQKETAIATIYGTELACYCRLEPAEVANEYTTRTFLHRSRYYPVCLIEEKVRQLTNRDRV